MIFSVLMLSFAAASMAFGLSPQPWREAHHKQYQVVLLVFSAGITAVLFTTGERMFVSIAWAASTLFTAVVVVGGYVKRSRASGRAS